MLAAKYYNHQGALYLVKTEVDQEACGAASMLRGPLLGPASCLSASPKAFWGEQLATSENERHLLLLSGTQSDQELTGDFELVVVDMNSFSIVARHSLDFRPAWFDFALDSR